MKEEIIQGNNYKIHYIKTDKFKSNKVVFAFGEETKDAKNFMIRKLLAELIKEYNTIYKTDRDFFKKSINLYNAKIGTKIVFSGPSNTIFIRTEFLNEEYTEKGMNLKCLDFGMDFIFNPDFSEDRISKIKKLAKEELNCVNENPSTKSIILARDMHDTNSCYSFNPYLLKDVLEGITQNDLKESYNRMLSENYIDIYCTGNFNDTFFNKLKNIFNSKSSKLKYIEGYKKLEKNVEGRIKGDFSQSKLSIICSIKDITDYEMSYVANLYNYILGSSGSSKLFVNVREKNSLCYAINSSFISSFSKLEIKAGINVENYNKTVDLVKTCLKEEVTIEELKQAKTYTISKINQALDNSSFYINCMINMTHYNKPEINVIVENISKVTLDEVNTFRNKIEVNTIFLLEGVLND